MSITTTEAEAEAELRYDATHRGDNYNELPTYPSRPSYREWSSRLALRTLCVVFEGAPGDPHKPSSVPIYQTATFVQPSATEFGSYDYSRSGNPTRTALEKQVAMLEGAHAAFAFTSGMAALAAVTRLLSAGDELLVGDDIYGGMHRLVSRVTSALHGITVRFVDTTDLASLEAALSPATRMVHMESPSNPLMRITDIRGLSRLLSSRRILLSIDSTMMTPVLQRPLSLGADIVVHSATKFFGGHSDVMGGLVCSRDEALSKRIAFFQNAEGSGLDPMSCWLFLRGIKTMALRVERAQENAARIATVLATHPLVTALYCPGFVSGGTSEAIRRAEADSAMHFSQASGAGAVLSFTTGSIAVSRRIIDALRIFKLTVSFGSVSSLCEMPCFLSHASIPADQRKLPEDLIRLSVGIEAVDDLLADIAQAFDLAAHPHVVNVRSVRRRDTADEEELAIMGGGGLLAGGDSSIASPTPDTPIVREDAAFVAREECARLAGTVRVLRERVADLEVAAAASEAARRGGGGGAAAAVPVKAAVPSGGAAAAPAGATAAPPAGGASRETSNVGGGANNLFVLLFAAASSTAFAVGALALAGVMLVRLTTSGSGGGGGRR